MDRESVLSLLTDDVEWIEWESPEGVARHHGKAEFEKNMNDSPGPGSLRVDIHRMTEENNVVLAECTVRVSLKEGRFMTVHAWDIFEFEAGKVRRLTAMTVITKDS
jgi:hypothetical protein